MKHACVTFLARHDGEPTPVIQPAASVAAAACAVENEALDILAKENMRLKRRLKFLKARHSTP